MAEPTKTSWNYVWVKDRAGNEFICDLKDLKDPKKCVRRRAEKLR
jgi:hypothetical protein